MTDLFRKMNLQLFAEGDPEPGNDPTPGTDPQDPPTGGGNDPGNDPKGDPEPGNGGKTFTQADMDRVIQQRLARERKAWEQQLEDEKKKAAMSEAERLKAEKEEAEKKATQAMDAANQRLIQAEVRLQVAELGIVDADAAHALMDREGVQVDEQGGVAGVKEALEALLTAKPWLKKATGNTRVGGGTNPPGGGGDDKPTGLAGAIARHYKT